MLVSALSSCPRTVSFGVMPPAVSATVTAQVLEFPNPTVTYSDDDKTEKLDISNVKILISEDDSLARSFLIDLLGGYLLLGHDNFLEAFNLQSALDVFERQQKNIRSVLTDIDMPNKYAGIDLYDELRGHFGFTGPIALMSGRPAHDPKIAKVVESDFDARFFPKPIVSVEPIGDWLRRGWS